MNDIRTRATSDPIHGESYEKVESGRRSTRAVRQCAAALVLALAGTATAGMLSAPAAGAAAPSLGTPCTYKVTYVASDPTCTKTFTSSGSVSLMDLGWAPGTPIEITSVGGAGGAAADGTHGGTAGAVTAVWTPTGSGGISWILGGNGQNGAARTGGAGGSGGLPSGAGAGGAGGNGSLISTGKPAGGGAGGGGGATGVFVSSNSLAWAVPQNQFQVSPGAGGGADLQGYGGNAAQSGAGAIQDAYTCQGGAAGTATSNGAGTCGGGDGSASGGGAGFTGDIPGGGHGYGVLIAVPAPIDGGGGGGGGLTGGAGGGDTVAIHSSDTQNGGTGGGGGFGTGQVSTSSTTVPQVKLVWQIPSVTTTTVSLSQTTTTPTHPVTVTATGHTLAPFPVANIDAGVQFYVDGAAYGKRIQANLDTESASTSLLLPPGTHTVKATFTPITSWDSSTSAPVTVTVAPSELVHATRSSNGSWTAAGDAGAAGHIPGSVLSVAGAATGSGEAQYVAATVDGRLWHTTRHTDGSWSASADDVAAAAQIPGTVVKVAGSASGEGESQYLVVTSDGHVWHTIRHADGSWQRAGDAAVSAHIPGKAVDAAVTSVLGSPDLQLLVVTSDGHVWHTIRHADGSWQGAGDAASAAGISATVVSAAATSNHDTGTQFVFITQDGHAWYTFRQLNGVWTPAVDAATTTHVPGTVVAATASWTVTENTEFLFLTSDGRAWHTIRHANASWDSAGNVTSALGLTSSAASAAAICTVSGEIQYVIAT